MSALSNEFTVKKMALRNRIVLPPLTTNYGSGEGFVTDKNIRFYKERSKAVGLVIVEATAVQSNGRIVPGSLGLWNDSQISGMAGLVKSIKEKGALAVVQLNHAGARCVPSAKLVHGFSPSGIPFRPDVRPVIMGVAEIEHLVDDFGSAAVRASEAGFDGVEIHGAHLYLISQFLSPLTNKRDDQYGGDAKGRATVALEIVSTMRKRLGQEYPIFFRLNAVERMESGQGLEDALVIARSLADVGVDVLDVSLIAHGGWKQVGNQKLIVGSSALPKDESSGANVNLAAIFKKKIGFPVIAVGKLGNGRVASEAVSDKGIDMVAIGRQMICDPETARKMLDETYDNIIPCEECLNCLATIGRGVPMACKVNNNLPY